MAIDPATKVAVGMGIAILAISLAVPELLLSPKVARAREMPLPPAQQVCGSVAASRTAQDGLAIPVANDRDLRLRLPQNHDPRFAWPVLLVLPPAGYGAKPAERYYGLTTQATAEGYVLAYAGHRPLSRASVDRPSAMIAALERVVCVAPDQIVVVGHSDGGTVGLMASALGRLGNEVGVVASGLGVQGTDLSRDCPASRQIAVIHSDHDTHFPGFGASTVNGIADCWGCTPPQPAVGDCATTICGEGGTRRLTFCRTNADHAVAPDPGLILTLARQIMRPEMPAPNRP
jgi:hypothetical protein